MGRFPPQEPAAEQVLIADTLANWLREQGYEDASYVSPTIVSLFHARIGSRVFLHIDESFLVLEQPHEMGAAGRRPRENYELWVDLNDPESLPQMLSYLSQITSWADSPRRSRS